MSDLVVTGWLLVIGPVAFLVGAGTYYWAVMRTPADQYLESVDRQPRLWRFTNLWLLAGSVVTAAGLDTLAALVAEPGAGGLAMAGAALFDIATVLWALSLVYRLSVVPAVAARFADTREVVTASDADRWVGGLFAGFVVLAAAGLVVIGAALAIGGPTPVFVGVGTSLFALIVLGGFVLAGDTPPLLLFLPPLALGIAVLVGAR